jgi:predicted short-subunit dehydrogenase-like oxidoreductase (DUF2520 family)
MSDLFKHLVLIGSGNTAATLGNLFLVNGLPPAGIFGRNRSETKTLAKEWNCLEGSLEEISMKEGIFFICVSDRAIAEVAHLLPLNNSIVVHCSGAQSLSILPFENKGVFYPLQSLLKNRVPTTSIPLLIQSSNDFTHQTLMHLAQLLSPIVKQVSDEQRLKIHLAAVLASNFTNHLYALAYDYCKKEQLDYALLAPIMIEVTSRASTQDPAQLQTGPAIRHDVETIEKHLKLLNDNPGLRELYEFLTTSIQRL